VRVREIRSQIEAAVNDEKATGRMAAGIKEFVKRMGLPATAQDIAQTVAFSQQYVEFVPAVIEMVEKSARDMGLANEAAAILNPVEHYWFEPNDVLPDNQGLVGLVDDAYVALSVMQGMSNNCRTSFGRPLISMDLTQPNAQMRFVIGEPAASQLDGVVVAALNGPIVQSMLQAINQWGARFPINTPHPIWGNASVDDIVKTQLGAMGIF
jgi:hypothetical protein